MTNPTQPLDSGSVGSEAPAGQQVSTDPQSVQPDSTVNANEELAKQVQELTGQVRALQSDKDRAGHRAEQIATQTQNELARILELSKAGMSETQIQRELAVDRILAGQQQAVSPQNSTQQAVSTEAGAPQTTRAQAEPFEVAAVVKALNLSHEDADVSKILFESKGDPAYVQQQLMALAIRRDSAETPSSAAAPAVSGGMVSTNANKTEETAAALEKAAISGNMVEADRLQKELDALTQS